MGKLKLVMLRGYEECFSLFWLACKLLALNILPILLQFIDSSLPKPYLTESQWSTFFIYILPLSVLVFLLVVFSFVCVGIKLYKFAKN